MAKNNKPILSVLIDDDKRTKFADLARRYKYSMGWLINDAIDRMLVADSINIYTDSIGNIENAPRFEPVSISMADIEEMIKNSIDNLDIEALVKPYIPNPDISSVGTLDVEEIVKSSIASLNILSIGIDDVEELVKSSIDSIDIESVVRTSIEPLSTRLTGMEVYTHSQFEAVREELKRFECAIALTPDPTPTNHSQRTMKLELSDDRTSTPTDTDHTPRGGTKSWGKFFKMVGLEGLTGSEAQRVENIDVRARQIEEGLQAAREQGLGEWEVHVVGRSFVRVND